MGSGPPVHEDDVATIAAYVASFRWPGRDATAVAAMIEGGAPLWREILRRVPNPPTRGRALELGSPPYNLTVLLRRFRNYDLALTAGVGGGLDEIVHEIESPTYGERHRFVCRVFDIESEPFPYDDAAFDLVLWCEVLEHLTADPVHALAEIHRVLRPGGHLLVTTPNVTSVAHIAALLRGENVYDPYHLGAGFRGTRHSREYTREELYALVAGCGFGVERLDVVDVERPRTRLGRLLHPLLVHGVARLTGSSYRSNLFLLAERTERPFRWHFPPAVFDAGHVARHVAPRDVRVVMGENDEIHTSSGWGPLDAGPDGRVQRRCHVGEVHLLAGSRPQVTLVVTGGQAEVAVWCDGPASRMVAWRQVEHPDGVWHTVHIPLEEPVRPGTPLRLRVASLHGIGVHSAAGE
ncbi:MAG TPA: methyltransferase domain-containing protein [Candidatus Binatia bacterium]|nr:methyltransferase domain-containing protein [Candidatus Binatia bacterium]